MKFTVAPDSLKESLSAADAAEAIERGIARAAPGAQIELVPIADGGEGTVAAVVSATGGDFRTVRASDPLGRPVGATWGLSGDGENAIIEMAAASGLELLAPQERDPLRTSTRGTGEMIAAALDAGVKRIVVGIGGSATVDGGTGMATAMGVRFLDAEGNPIPDCCGGRLADIHGIDLSGRDPRLDAVEVVVACDVENPLTGPDGAARVYGPQKGAGPDDVELLEGGLANLARVVRTEFGLDVAEMPGAGAAGGLGFGLVAFLGARLESGARTVIETVRLAERMRGSDLVITAEGRLDGQSAFGKAVAGVAAVAAELDIPVVVLAGSLGPGYRRMYERSVCAAFSIAKGPGDLASALARAGEDLEDCAESVARLWLGARGGCDAGA